jgi:hypothetical protein
MLRTHVGTNLGSHIISENVAIAMLNIEDSNQNKKYCYTFIINLQWKGVQIYIDDEAKDSFMSSATSDE